MAFWLVVEQSRFKSQINPVYPVKGGNNIPAHPILDASVVVSQGRNKT